MRVLNVNSLLSTNLGGGTAQRTRDMSIHLSRAGVDCSILTNNEDLDNPANGIPEEIEVHALQYVSRRFYIPLPTSMKLLTLFRQADIVHLMGHWTPINILAYVLIRFYRKPYVVCPAGALPIFGRSKLFKRFYNKIVGKRIIKNADGCIAVTPDEISHFLSYGVQEEKITIIPNGIDAEVGELADEARFREKYGIQNVPYILYIGRLNSIKGVDLFIDAICKISRKTLGDYHVLVAGRDEGLLEVLKSKVSQNNLTNQIHFIGFIEGSEKRRAFKSAELLVIPSRQEAMSIVVLEAGIVGTPVLITDRCGFDQIDALQCGWVCSASVEGVTEGLRSFFKSNLGNEYGNNLQKFVLENYVWGRVVDKYLIFYKKILDDVGKSIEK